MQRCDRCGDLGILRIRNTEQDLDALVCCLCDWGKEKIQIWRLPRLTKKIESAFEVTRCPPEWFRPENAKGSVPRGSFEATIKKKRDEWIATVRRAESFWVEWGNVFTDEKHHMEGR